MNFKSISFLLCFFSILSLNAQVELKPQLDEKMPRFYSEECEELTAQGIDGAEKCAQKAMLEFIYVNIKYPKIARENGVEGTVVIRFIIDKDGVIKDAEILREIGAGCGEEAKRVIEMMPNWVPGEQFGKPVPVYFNLPIKFGLEKKKKKKKKRKNKD